MKDNIQVLLNALRDERSSLEKEKQHIAEQIRSLNDTRKRLAKTFVSDALPDLSQKTIESLQRDIPGFQIPMISKWFGLKKKIDPNATLDTLRIQLGAYLDNTPGSWPKRWENGVGHIDNGIERWLTLDASNRRRLTDVAARMAALEKLHSADTAKMDPKLRQRIQSAVASQANAVKSTTGTYHSTERVLPRTMMYPSNTQVRSDSGPDLLEMWLWYQLLTPSSDCSHEIARLEGGGGGFDGGGASETWGDGPKDGLAEITPSVSHVSIESQLATQAALGSQNFS